MKIPLLNMQCSYIVTYSKYPIESELRVHCTLLQTNVRVATGEDNKCTVFSTLMKFCSCMIQYSHTHIHMQGSTHTHRFQPHAGHTVS